MCSRWTTSAAVRAVAGDRVREMHPLFNGDQLVVMKNGKELTLSRNYRDRLKELLESF